MGLLNGIPIVGGCAADLGGCASVISIGLFNGLIIALIAMGYSLVFGILGLINFAHGDVFMVGSMLMLFGVQLLGLTEHSSGLVIIGGLCLLLPVIMALTAALNAGIERFAYRPLRRTTGLATLIAAIGVSFVLENVGIALLGPSQRAIPQLIPATVILQLGSIQVHLGDLFVAAVTVPLLMLLAWMVARTRYGVMMRAVAQDREMAAVLGIDVNATIAATFAVAGALAGGAGVVVALYVGQTWWFAGFPFGLLSFTAAVVGGIGNLPGAAVGAVCLGVLKALVDYYIDPRWTDPIVFTVLVLVLVVRPSGLLGARDPLS